MKTDFSPVSHLLEKYMIIMKRLLRPIKTSGEIDVLNKLMFTPKDVALFLEQIEELQGYDINVEIDSSGE